MESRLFEIGMRIRDLREILGLTEEEMAVKTDVTTEEYREHEAGQRDFSFTFLYLCSKSFGVDIIELLTGENPKLSYYSIVRAGTGLPMRRRKGFTYQHVAYRIKEKISEPFVVTAPFSEEEQNQPIHLSRHTGQEFDFILKGSLKVQIENHIEVLNEGDAIYYNSAYGHGMVATGGQDCVFLAVVMAVGEQGNTDEKEDAGL